jgi:hypothetical protein
LYYYNFKNIFCAILRTNCLLDFVHRPLKIVEEVEKNPGEKRVDIAKRLGLAPSTLNSFSGMNKDKFEDYISGDSHVATCGVETVQELGVSLVAFGSVEGEGGGEEDGEPPKLCRALLRCMKR